MDAKGVYRASRKTVNEKTGKTYWNEVGLTVWIGEYEGKVSVSVVDERTGQRFPCFPPKSRANSEATETDTHEGAGVPF
jgi:hypothetical protein